MKQLLLFGDDGDDPEDDPPPPPPPPTGPPTDVSEFGDADYGGFLRWRESEIGRRYCDEIERAALTFAAQGHQRISVNALHELARQRLHLKGCNTYRPWIADELVAKHPHLLDLIERRKRRKAAG